MVTSASLRVSELQHSADIPCGAMACCLPRAGMVAVLNSYSDLAKASVGGGFDRLQHPGTRVQEPGRKFTINKLLVMLLSSLARFMT